MFSHRLWLFVCGNIACMVHYFCTCKMQSIIFKETIFVAGGECLCIWWISQYCIHSIFILLIQCQKPHAATFCACIHNPSPVTVVFGQNTYITLYLVRTILYVLWSVVNLLEYSPMAQAKHRNINLQFYIVQCITTCSYVPYEFVCKGDHPVFHAWFKWLSLSPIPVCGRGFSCIKLKTHIIISREY